VLVDHVLSVLGGRTAAQAIEAGSSRGPCGGRCARTSMSRATTG